MASACDLADFPFLNLPLQAFPLRQCLRLTLLGICGVTAPSQAPESP